MFTAMIAFVAEPAVLERNATWKMSPGSTVIGIGDDAVKTAPAALNHPVTDTWISITGLLFEFL